MMKRARQAKRRRTVPMAMNNGGFTWVPAEFYGIWAVHMVGQDDWRVTHAPSGRAASTGLSQSAATLLALLLATRMSHDWVVHLERDQQWPPPKKEEEWWDWALIFEATVAEVEGAGC